MKKYAFVLMTGFFAFFQSSAQIQLHESGNHGLMRVSVKESDKMKGVEGSPYLDENFQYGIATIKGKEPLSVFLRYNVHQDQMEIKIDPKNDETYALPKNANTVYEIGPQTFVFDEILSNGNKVSGYFIRQYDGEKYRLLIKPVVSLTEPVKAKTGYEKDRPARIIIEKEYYVVNNNNGKVENVRLKHRDIGKAFNSEPAKQYLRDNKIRSEEDFKSFIEYLDVQ